MQKNKYLQSINDIDNFFLLLTYFDSIEAYKNFKLPSTCCHEELLVTSTQQKCMRSHAVMMLYNVMESTVVECITSIWDAIIDDHLRYGELIDSIQNSWLMSTFDNYDSPKTRMNKTKEIIKNIDSPIVYKNAINRFNGNVDLRLILSVCSEFGLQLGQIPDIDSLSKVLKQIKDARNHLAHGDITFSSYGSLISLSDILSYKTLLFTFLSFFIDRIDNYITNKKYKRSTL